MTVIVVTACSSGVRGLMSRWLLEIAPGVFVGRISARVREKLWERLRLMLKNGRAIMTYSAHNEQHMKFEVLQPDWKVVDCDGVSLVKRPHGTDDVTLMGPLKTGWSKARRLHSARKYN